MKIAILLGRGTEGCGVTQCAIQMQIVTGATILSCVDKKWPRGKKIEFPGEYVEFKLKNGIDDELVTQLNSYDLVVVYSVPSKGHPQETQDNFLELLRRVNVRKSFINVDHNAQSISRNANLKEIVSEVDVAMTHSLSNPFSLWHAKEGISTPLRKMRLGFDFDGHRKKYWKDVRYQDGKVVRWIGRLAGWKGPQLMIDFHNQYLREYQFKTILEGLEASIGYKGVLYKDKEYKERRQCVNYFRPEKEYGDGKWSEDLHGYEVEGNVYLYPPYTHHDCMERMSLSGFGSDLYHLKPTMYGNNIENCHAEPVACGTIPIFHAHFGEHVIHHKIGDPVIQCENSGTIFLGPDSDYKTSEFMCKLARNPDMRNEYREMAFEFWKSHADGADVVNEIIEISINTTEAQEASPLESFFA
jgi:glycosyltransferase involved in cell wall biosynthesis